MNKGFLLAIMCLLFVNSSKAEERELHSSIKKIEHVDFSKVRIDDSFWSPRLSRHRSVTLPVCIDQIENQTGRIRNFENAAKRSGKHSGIFFDDSDVYKAVEGIAYTLANHPDATLKRKADEWIDKFAAAQLEDGYINTYYTLTGLENRWTDMDKHEMYCAGHLIEAGVAYYKATGERKLLDVGQKMADYMMTVFGPGKRNWVPGHEEIELALVKLYNVTHNAKYLKFAHWLLEERGQGFGRNHGLSNAIAYQDSVPVRDLDHAEGHAVRCMYLCCGMADVAALEHNTSYLNALDKIWANTVFKNMYITGGIGSTAHHEGFTTDYDLPNKEAYCETCASVGMVYWNQRMNELSGDAKYIDVLERSMYNGALAGINLKGDRFFYVNPLASDGDHHRQAWYGCACCPSQISRFLPSIGNYIYGVSDEALYVNLFIGNTANFEMKGKPFLISMDTNYPWDGKVNLTIQTNNNHQIMIRIPGWCNNYSLTVNGKTINTSIHNGYAALQRKWKKGDVIELNMEMPVEVVEADPRVVQNIGKRAIQRGPLVYCMEETDNKDDFDNLSISPNSEFKATFEPTLLDGIIKIDAVDTDRQLNFIPYYCWDNREAGKMKVWVDYKP